METAANTTQVILPILYTLLGVAYARIFARGAAGLALLARPLLWGTVLVHLVAIILRSVLAGSCPLGSRPEFLSLVAFAITLIYLILELRIGDRSTGIFAITPAFVLEVIAAISILGTGGIPESDMGWRDSLHTFAAVVGFSAVAVCSVYGILYLSLYGAIKRGRFGLFYRKMPSLEKLSELNLVAAWVAFLALSVTIALGLWGYLSAQGEAFSSRGGEGLVRLEITFTLILWALYGGCLVARIFLSLGNKRLAYTTVLGLFVLVLFFIGEFFKTGFHD